MSVKLQQWSGDLGFSQVDHAWNENFFINIRLWRNGGWRGFHWGRTGGWWWSAELEGDLPPACTRDIQPSHWSSSYIAALSLVDSSRVLKYFHAGRIIGANSDASISNLMPWRTSTSHPKPSTRGFWTQNTPIGGILRSKAPSRGL